MVSWLWRHSSGFWGGPELPGSGFTSQVQKNENQKNKLPGVPGLGEKPPLKACGICCISHLFSVPSPCVFQNWHQVVTQAVMWRLVCSCVTTVPKGLCPPVGMELPGIGIRSWAPELTLGPGLFVPCRTESTKMSCCVASGAQSWLRVQYVLGTETQRLALRGDGTAGRALAGPTLPPASLTGHLPAGALAAMTVCSSRL